MKTFVIFDKKTGEILQTHVQIDDLHYAPDELLKIARPGAQTEIVDLMTVESLALGTSYRVDVKGRKLIPVEVAKAKGGGGARVLPAGGDPLMAQTVIFNLGEKKK